MDCMSNALPPAVVISIALTLLWLDWSRGVLSILFLLAIGGIAVHAWLLVVSVRRHIRDLAKGLDRLPQESISAVRLSIINTLARVKS